jgi:stage V sporulation protein AD
VLNGYLLPLMQRGEIRRMIFMATGALLSTTSNQQGDTIPGIAHAIALEADS